MIKRKWFIWIASGVLLLFLYILSSTDLIIKEKKQDVSVISIILDDEKDDYYMNFRMGADKAASYYNADVNFVTLYDEEKPEEQMELVDREINNGAEAVILIPVSSEEVRNKMEHNQVKRPVITVGNLGSSEYVSASIEIDYAQIARKLADAIIEEQDNTNSVYIFSKGQQFEKNMILYSEIKERLEAAGFDVRLCTDNEENLFREVIEAQVYSESKGIIIAAIDAQSLYTASAIVSNSPVYGNYVKGIYGVDSTTAILNKLDMGAIKGIVVSDWYDMGYSAVEKAVGAIKNASDNSVVSYENFYIEKDSLRDSKMEKMLYPLG